MNHFILVLSIGYLFNFLTSISVIIHNWYEGNDLQLEDLIASFLVSLFPYATFLLVSFVYIKDFLEEHRYKSILKGRKK